jgi:aromatic ring-opening dioxygenase catalytic subunit (LigB family)
MGEIVGAGLLSHAPVVMFNESFRIASNGGRDFTLATGLHRLRQEVFEQVGHETVVVIDSHWATTTEFVVTAHGKRAGIFTSSEMPTALKNIPYDLPGDPELAHAIAQEATDGGAWAAAVDDPYLPIQYATLNLASYLAKPGKAWISISVCQTATFEDFQQMGRAMSRAITKTRRRVILLASGGLSHVFHPLAQIRRHMSGDPENIINDEARAADQDRIEWLMAGQHRRVIQAMPEFLKFAPEARFGHYLLLAGALGGEECTLPAERLSEYESGIGTGQVHLWFRPRELKCSRTSPRNLDDCCGHSETKLKAI